MDPVRELSQLDSRISDDSGYVSMAPDYDNDSADVAMAIAIGGHSGDSVSSDVSMAPTDQRSRASDSADSSLPSFDLSDGRTRRPTDHPDPPPADAPSPVMEMMITTTHMLFAILTYHQVPRGVI